MRKFWILLYVATLAAPSTGCCGRIRNLFHRGAPCGTQAVSGAILGGPVTVPGAVVSGPMVSTGVCEQQCIPCEQQCVPCDPCASSGYGDCSCVEGPTMGEWSNAGYVGGDSGCADCNDGIQFSSDVPMSSDPGPIPAQ